MALHRAIPTRAVLIGLLVTGVAGLALGVGAVPDDGTAVSDANVTVLGADGDVFDRIDEVEDMRAMTANGTFDRAEEYDEPVVYGDTFAVRIRSDVLTDRYADAEGANASERFFSLFDDSNANLTARALVGPQRQPYDMALERSNPRVIHDGENATFYVVVDSESVVVTEDESDERYHYFPSHDDIEVSVETRTDGETVRAEDVFTYVGPDAELTSDRSSLRLGGGGPARIDANATALTLNGHTNLLPGRDVTLQAVAPNGTVLETAGARTTANTTTAEGRKEVRSDVRLHLTDAPTDDGDWFRLRATVHNRTLWERAVVVGPEPRWSNLSVRAVDVTNDSWTLRVNATLSIPDDGLFEVNVRTEDDFYSKRVSAPPGRSTQTIEFQGLRSRLDDPVELETYWDADENDDYNVPPDDLYGTTADVPGQRWGELEVELPVENADEIDLGQSTTPTASPTPTDTPTPTDSESRTATATTAATTSVISTSGPDTATTPTLTVAKPRATQTGTGETGTPQDTATTGTTADDGPGFGIGLAVLALLVLTLGLSGRGRSP